jgi:ABC-2 type transport system permease protein
MTVIELPIERRIALETFGPAPLQFRRLVIAEYGKLRSTKGFVILSFVAAALAALGSIGIGTTLDKPHGVNPHTSMGLQKALSSGFTAGLIATILGALFVTSEFRYKTCSQSILDCGSRTRWYLAKMPVVAIAGVAITAIGQFAAVATALPFLSAKGIHPDLWSGTLLRMTLGTIALGLPTALLGLAIGLLLRSQVATTAGIILYTMAAEAAMVQFVPAVGRWLPGGAQASLVADPTLPYHNTLTGVLVITVWILLVTSLGLSRLRRTDVPG